MNYTVNRSYKIAFTKASGFTYTITSSKPNVTNISKPNGTINKGSGTINVTFTLNGLDAFTNNVINITATDINTNCVISNSTDNLTKLSPCLSLSVDILNTPNTLSYEAKVLNGKAPYQYEWSFDTNNFESLGSTTSNRLDLRNKVNVSSHTVTVKVTDSNKCVTAKTVAFTQCYPVVKNIISTNDCITINNKDYNKYRITLENDSCGQLTTELKAVDSSFIYSISHITGQTYDIIIEEEFNNNFKFFYITNTLGYKSNNFSVIFNKTKDCKKPINCSPITANDITKEVLSTESSVTIPINVQGDDVDYNTFTFIPSDFQTLINPFELKQGLEKAIFNSTTRSITYTYNILSNRIDIIINWTIKDKCGNSIVNDTENDYVTISLLNKVVEVPNISNKQGKVIKGKVSTITVDNVSNLRVINSPITGTVSVSNNNIIYNSSEIGTYSVDLIPFNNGVSGGIFTSSYEVVSSGTPINVNSCNLGLENLFNYISGATSGGLWLGVNNSLSIINNYVDFTSVPLGQYIFAYRVTAGVDEEITNVTFNKYNFEIKSIQVIASQNNKHRIVITHEGLLINDIEESTYNLNNGEATTITLEPTVTPTSYSFIVTADAVNSITHNVTTSCGVKTIEYVRPVIIIDNANTTGIGNAIGLLDIQPVKSLTASVTGRGVFLSSVVLEIPTVIDCTNGMDVVFVLDYTSSMGSVIENIKTEIENIKTSIITESGNDYRLGLVLFDEAVSSTPNYSAASGYTSLPSAQKITESNSFNTKYQFITAMEVMSTNNGTTFTTQLNKINNPSNMVLGSGASLPEPSDIAMYHVVKNSSPITGTFRNDVAKLVILITDALPSGNDDTNNGDDLTYITNTLTPLFLDKDIKLLLLSSRNPQTQYETLVNATGGRTVYSSVFDSTDIIDTIEDICI